MTPAHPWIVRRLLPEGMQPDTPEAQSRLGMVEGAIGAGISLLLASVKVGLGLVTGSVSMMADAFNNLTDTATSALIWLSFRWSRKPRDAEHPFGHGRMETIAGLVLSIALIVVGIEVGRAGLERMLHPEPIHVTGWVLVVTFVAIVVKALLAFFAWVLAHATGSITLRADAWNHFFDILSSGLVLVALFGAQVGQPRLDGWCGLGVAGFILAAGIRFARETVDTLLGKPADPELLKQIEALALSVPGVCGAHDIIVHEYGHTRIITLHIEIHAQQTPLACHALAERVEQVISRELAAKVMVHADPVDRSHPFYATAKEGLQRLVQKDARLVAFHDLRVEGVDEACRLAVDLVTPEDVPATLFNAILEHVADRIFVQWPELACLDLGIETAYASDPEFRRRFKR